MSFQIHRSERADTLAEELGEVLAIPLDDPFTAEVVAVPTQGVERWLAQTLSHRLGTSERGRDGICAGVEFPSPRRLTNEAVASATDIDARTDPWLPRRAVWPLLGVIDAARGESWAALLWSYFGDRVAADPVGAAPGTDIVRRGRRWSTAQHLAELFSAYAGSRPQMIRSWVAGSTVDASGRALPLEYAWQAELWRRLRAEIGTPSPAERTLAACERLVEDPSASPLPQRVSVFGPTRLSPDHLLVLDALARHRDVHLWLSHPSPELWNRMSARPRLPAGGGPRASDRTLDLPANPLLGYLGRDVRELQLVLSSPLLDATRTIDVASPDPGSAGPDGADAHVGVDRLDLHHPAPRPPSDESLTLLQRLQDDLVHDRPLRPLAERPLLALHDRSVTVHASHGPDRQVEVLRELLVGLLDDDSSLQPRDIVVMCPDIERFAPLISSSFGLEHGDPLEHPGHRLRVRLADRALRQVNPLLAALSQALGLADSRLEASALLDFCALAPVSRKFAFGEDDLERLQDLVTRSGVRWGLDVDHRQSFAMGQFAQNTWAAGLDRLLLGVTMDETQQQFIGTALPLDDVDSSDVELIGRLAELVERLRWLLGEFQASRSLIGWIDLCRQCVDLLTSVSPSDNWQTAHAYAELGALAQLADEEAGTVLSLAEVRALLAETFRGRATRANFRTGTLTMCTMMPMRSVPHRVVCLLGVDDGVFPRHSARDGDDILAADPWIGDRDPRSEDRQLLLDAIMSAQDHLLVIYSGADARTRAPKPPAVPIGALLDSLEATARTIDGSPVRDQIQTLHPLQPFDRSNFEVAALDHRSRTSFSFDRASWRGATAASRPRTPVPSHLDARGLSVFELPEVVALTDLVRFFNHPVRALLRSRAGLSSGAWEDEDGLDQIPVRLDGLQSWAIGDRLLRLHLDGADLDRLTAAEWRRGGLPPRGFGGRALGPVVDNVRQISEASRPFLTEPRRNADVLAPLVGHTVAGTLTHVRGHQLVTVNYSWLGPKHRLQAWLELLALTVSHEDHAWQAVTIGRGRPSYLGPVPKEWASRVLSDLVDLYRTGLSEPIPLSAKAGSEYARIRLDGRSVSNFADKLDKLWLEDRDRAYESFFGAGISFDDLLKLPSVPQEERGSLAEPSRFGSLARRVWHPLLQSEVMG